VFGLSASALDKERATAEWLFDLLAKLGQEDDAYHATALILMEYSSEVSPPDEGDEPTEGIPQPGVDLEDDGAPSPHVDTDRAIGRLPKVSIRLDETPEELLPGRFLASMVDRVLRATPVDVHREARKRRTAAS
jgi:hypothetical protein